MLIKAENCCALVVDIQQKLLPHMHQHQQLLNNALLLIEGLQLLEVPIILNEQYPKGLGASAPPISALLNNTTPYEKVSFSCCGNAPTKQKIDSLGKTHAIVFGIESHVCVMQTCLELLGMAITPIVVSDCMSSRKEHDHQTALLRLVEQGAIPATYESLLFELCQSAKHPQFKQISNLVK